MTAFDWTFYYAMEAIQWLDPVVCVLGLGIAVLAFLRSRKRGYLMVALYFWLAVFSLTPLNRAWRAHHTPDLSVQTREKINEAVKQATDRVLEQEGHPAPASERVNFPLGQIVLVFGLWLVARREPRREVTQLISPEILSGKP